MVLVRNLSRASLKGRLAARVVLPVSRAFDGFSPLWYQRGINEILEKRSLARLSSLSH
jgi:hypothetical protein